MSANLIFLPVLVQILLTLVVYISLGRAKGAASKMGLVDEKRRGISDEAWPLSVQLINNNIRNQFETPTLFYILTLILWIIDSVTLLVHLLAWLYVISRGVHAWAHIKMHNIPLRRRLFQCSIIILFALTFLTLIAVLRSI